MKNSSDTTGNRTRDLPAYSAVPQPTAPLRAPTLIIVFFVIILGHFIIKFIFICFYY